MHPTLPVSSLLVTLLAIGCKSPTKSTTPPPPPPSPPGVASVQLSTIAATLDIGDHLPLTATLRDEEGNPLTGRAITWHSSAPAVATYGGGQVTAVSAGTTTLTATSEGKSAAAHITVRKVAVASIDLSANAATLKDGEAITLVATPRDATGTALTDRAITWNSSNPAVATVTNGLVTAVSRGLATITATSEGKSATAAITVQSCASTQPTGRLTIRTDSLLRDATYRTHGGWTIRISGSTLRMTEPSGVFFAENWGVEGTTRMAHENLKGKQIKDYLGTQRTHILSDSTKITINGTYSATQAQVTIYDSDETHRILSGGASQQVVWSCALPQFSDELEYDGETSQLSFDAEGMVWNNIYMEAAGPNGIAGVRTPGVVSLGRTYFLDPTRITDFYDDPRTGAT